MELSLDLSLVWVPKTMSEFLNQVSEISDGSKRSSMIDDYANRLKSELKKIAAFKRELPLCMLLLNDAIERLEEEAEKCKEANSLRCGGEQVLPLIEYIEEGGADVKEKNSEEKKNWMSSVQLWSAGIDSGDKKQDFGPQLNLKCEEKTIEVCKDRSRGAAAFVPFKAQPEKNPETDMSGLSLTTPVSSSLNPEDPNNPPKLQRRQQHSPRKQRRCWSPELHRRFVAALQQLGGSHAATPKQIRELMQVDGLTNDEVKSHLQKYRLHIRKLPNSSMEKANNLWNVPSEHAKANASQSGSPQGPLHGNGQAKVNSSSHSLEPEEEEEEESSDGCHSHNWRDNDNTMFIQ